MLGQLIADLGANEVDSPEFHVGIIRGQYFTQRFPDCVGFDADLRRQSNLHIGVCPKPRHSIILETSITQSSANALQVCRLCIADFEQYPARKIDAEIKTSNGE